MTTVTITIAVDADGEVRVNGPNGVAVPARPGAFQDELVPLPPESGQFRPIATTGRPLSAPARTNGLCPIHGEAWKVVPAGVSMKSGRPKPYAEFWACPEPGCSERPR
jgi:hypothetical protein